MGTDCDGRPVDFTPVKEELSGPSGYDEQWRQLIYCRCGLLHVQYHSAKVIRHGGRMLEWSLEVQRKQFAAMAHNPGCEAFV